MQHLLAKDTFDGFLFYEGQIHTSSSFELDGKINREFFDSEELAALTDSFVPWSKIRNICFEIIKGKKVPTKMKLVLGLSKVHYPDVIKKCGVSYTPADLGGFYLHINYEHDTIQLITGTTLNLFTLDKSLDQYWDHTMETFLNQYFDIEKI